MRFKFRIWDKKYRTFDYNDSPDVFIGTDGKVYDREERTLGDQRDVEYIESDNYVISQWTGLHDKNGKEIYEGDILKPKHSKDNGVNKVVWYRNGFMIEYTFMRKWEGEEYEDRNYVPIYPESYEVIGNIYEHNHLLEGEVNVKGD